MTHQSYVTYDEIITQTQAWMEAVRVVSGDAEKIEKLDLKSYRQAIFIGCGSTYYLSLSAASIFQSMTGVPARAFPSSELLFFPERLIATE